MQIKLAVDDFYGDDLPIVCFVHTLQFDFVFGGGILLERFSVKCVLIGGPAVCPFSDTVWSVGCPVGISLCEPKRNDCKQEGMKHAHVFCCTLFYFYFYLIISRLDHKEDNPLHSHEYGTEKKYYLMYTNCL